MTDLKYPALRARLTQTTTPSGARGWTVHCADTGDALGFVWWEANGSTVAWHYRGPNGFGSTMTEQRAVARLRHLHDSPDLPFGEVVETPAQKTRPVARPMTGRPAASTPQSLPTLPPAPPVWQPAKAPISWDDTPAGDLTAAVVAAMRRRS